MLARQLSDRYKSGSKSCPETQFILDHCGVPEVKDQKFEPWREHIRELAKLPNVSCKISGLVAYANPANWKAEDFRPFVDHVIECVRLGSRDVWKRLARLQPHCQLQAVGRNAVSLTSAAGETNQRKLFQR